MKAIDRNWKRKEEKRKDPVEAEDGLNIFCLATNHRYIKTKRYVFLALLSRAFLSTIFPKSGKEKQKTRKFFCRSRPDPISDSYMNIFFAWIMWIECWIALRRAKNNLIRFVLLLCKDKMFFPSILKSNFKWRTILYLF
jgi:hypothetical protein